MSTLKNKKQKTVHGFIADLFIIAKMWQQPKCPTVGEWINTMCYNQIMKYYSL